MQGKAFAIIDSNLKLVAGTSDEPPAPGTAPAIRRPFARLRGEVDRLFEDFDWGFGPHAWSGPREQATILRSGLGDFAPDGGTCEHPSRM